MNSWKETQKERKQAHKEKKIRDLECTEGRFLESKRGGGGERQRERERQEERKKEIKKERKKERK